MGQEFERKGKGGYSDGSDREKRREEGGGKGREKIVM